MKKALFLSLACFMLGIIEISAATTSKIKITGLKASPSPFSPNLNSLSVKAKIIQTAPGIFLFPITWFSIITDQIVTKENWDEVLPSHVFFRTNGLGANVGFSWNGKKSKGNFAPDGKYYVYVGAWELGKRWNVKYIEVILDKTSPVITITSPLNGSQTEEEKITIVGSVNEKVSSFKINGQNVSLNQQTFNHETGLAIGENNMQIQAEDLAGNKTSLILKVTRIQSDREPPVITILEPEDGFLTPEENIEMKAEVNEISTITINSEVIGVLQGTFTKTISLTEGQNTLSIQAKDPAGNETSQNLTVTKDSTAPEIQGLSPEDAWTTGQQTIRITGRVNEALQSFQIQGQEAILQPDLSFEKTMSLIPGLNEILISLMDLAGNSFVQTLHIYYDNAAPLITLQSHQDGQWVNTNTVTLTGEVDDASAQLWINNTSTELAQDGTFSAEEELETGENIFNFRAEDLYGNSSENQFHIYLDIEPPEIRLDPAGGILPINTPTFKVEYQDQESGIRLETLEILFDGQNITELFNIQNNHAEYHPAAGLPEGEHNWTVHVQDAAGNPMTAGASFTIQSVEPPQENINQGFIVGTLKDSGTGELIKNAVIQIDELEGAAVSNEEGFFSFPVPESIYYRVRITKEGYISAARKIEALKTRTVGLGDILLKKEDTRKTLITDQGGVAIDSQGLIELTFPANAVQSPIQAGATWFTKGEELPGPLPEASQFTYAMELSPDGTVFNTPVTVRFKNTRGFAPGTEIPVGVWNKDLIQWTHETTSKVTPDGQWIEFQVMHFSTRDSNLPPPPQPAVASRTKAENQAQSPECGDPGNSTVDFLNGGLREKITLAGYKVLNQENALHLKYNSEYVNPYFRARIVKGENTTGTKIPDRVSVGVDFEGQNQTVHIDQGLNKFSLNFLLRKENAQKERLETGLYTWKGKISYDYLGLNYWYTHQFGGPPTWDTHIPMNDNEYAQYASFLKGAYVNINEAESTFGAGWQIQGVDRLYEDPAGSGFLITGGGDYEQFNPQYHVYAALGKNGSAGGKTVDVETVTESISANYTSEKVKFLAIKPDGSKLYMGSSSEQYLRVIDLRTGQNIKTLDLSKDHTSMLISPKGDRLYVGGRNSGNVPVIHVIDTATDSVIQQIQTRGFVNSIAVSPDEMKLYTAEITTSGISYIEIFSLPNLTKDKEILPGTVLGIPSFPSKVVVSPDGRKVYVIVLSTQQTWGYIFCLDTQTQNLTQIIANTISPNDIAFSPDSSRAYATYPSPAIFNNPYPGFVSIIDTVQDQVIGNITLGLPYYPQMITISPDGKRGYVPSTNKTIGVFDLEKNTLIENITVNPVPYKTIITPDGKKLYALCYQTNNYLLGLDTSSGSLTQTLTLSSGQANMGDLIVSPESTLKHIALDESTITKESDGTYTRTYLDQTKDYFDAQGYKTQSCDTHDNCTEYRYQITEDGGQKLLEKITDPKGQETIFTYNAQGKLEKITDPQGRTTFFQIDDHGDLTRMTHPDGSSYAFTYDEEHRLLKKTTPRGHATKYNYDEYGFIKSVEAPTGEIREYKPGILDQIVNDIPGAVEGDVTPEIGYEKGSYSERKDTYGNITKRWLDQNGRIIKTEDALGRIIEYEYDARGNLIKTTYPNGAVETRSYDLKGNLLTKTLEDIEATTTYTYDAKWNKPASIKDAENHITTFEYDAATGDLVKLTDAKNNVWRITYTSEGLLETITDPQNNITNYSYDVQGNLKTKTNALGHIWTYARDSAGNIIQITNPLNHSSNYTYDSMNRVIQIIDAEGMPDEALAQSGGVTQISYIDSGCTSCGAKTDLITSITDPNGNTTHFEYDEIGQLISITDALGNKTEKTYNLNRLLERVRDANNHVTEYRYNEINELIEEEAADGGIILYSYNDLGKLGSLTDPNGNVTTFNYDAIGRLTSEIDPLGHATQYQYDKVNNLTQKITPNNHSITYIYDELNRLIQKSTPEQNYTYAYDELGRLISAVNGSSDLAFEYDAIGQLTQSVVILGLDPGIQNTIDYAYDSAGRKISMREAEGSPTETSGSTGTTQYEYDGNDRLVTLIDPYHNHFTIEYDLGGRRTGLEGPGGISKTYQYDEANHLLELINKVNGVEIAPFQYTYDRVGNKTQITDKHGNHTANYDQVYRLISLTNSVIPVRQSASGGEAGIQSISDVIPVETGIQESLETFDYDKTGNRTSDQSQTYSSNEVNQLMSGSNGLSLAYDANGNVTSKTENGITSTYTWNSENQLTRSVILGLDPGIQTTFEYAYDPLGRRISKTVTHAKETITTHWVYDGEDILLEYENGVLASRYTHGPNIDEPLAKRDIPTGQNYYYHADALGSIMAITDNSGAIIESYNYTGFGMPVIFDENNREITQTTVNNFYLFTGREYDTDTGLYYYRNRYYDSRIGRFISKDPLKFVDGPNLYSYVLNNPVNLIDPWGLDSPGCDVIGNDQSPCKLECCADHDKCFDDNGCTQNSWEDDNCPSEECTKCNEDMIGCFFVQCTVNPHDDPNRPNYYCAKCNTFFDDPTSEHMEHSTN